MATEHLFVNIIIILVAARILGEVFQRIGQPPLVGELLAGLIIGPSIFGLVLPSTDLHVLTNLAVFFLMFLAGLEMDSREIRRSGRSAIVISIIASSSHCYRAHVHRFSLGLHRFSHYSWDYSCQ